MTNVHADDLIAQAETATTTEELDEIEAQAAGRVTVLDAVAARREALAATPQEGVDAVEEPPPPPIEAPPEVESLAAQVQRQAHEVPESTGPSDYVPNRPQIRPPTAEETVIDPDADAEGEAEPKTEPIA